MRIGFALPQSDHSIVGVSPMTYDVLLASARHAAGIGVDSLWLADHLVWDIAKYGGPADVGGMFEPIVTIGALARDVPDVRLGTLVLLEALRPASLLAKSVATLDRISGGRIDLGLGAGWYEPDYAGIGMEMPRPGVRLDRLTECVRIVKGLLGPDGGPVTLDGRYHRADGARVLPAAVQRPNPPVFVGGKGDRLLGIVAAYADGWNTCWQWTPDAYRERLDVLERACAAQDRDPATVWRSLGLYTLVGEDEADLARRFERLRTLTPPGVLDGVTLEAWRAGRLVGTVAEVQEQVGAWRDLGIETLILNTGAVPFAVGADDDLELAVDAIRRA